MTYRVTVSIIAFSLCALLFIASLAFAAWLPVAINKRPVRVALPYQLLEPQVVYFTIPLETTGALDDETLMGLVRQIHARGRDALVWICVPPRVRIVQEDYSCYALYFIRGNLAPDSGRRGARE